MTAMTGTLFALVISSVLFVGSHIVLPMASVRTRLVGGIGEAGYMIGYSVLSIALLAWMILAFTAAPEVILYEPGTAMRHSSLTLMLIASFLFVGGTFSRNAGTVQGAKLGWDPEIRGIFKITRHPVMWSVALWGISHMLANGRLAAWVFFGAMTVLALAGAAHIDRRKRVAMGEVWENFEASTSFWPLGAIAMGRTRMEKGEIPWWQTLLAIVIYVGMLIGHEWAGRVVFPILSFG